ncbi:MAG: manganese-dependent inorganic pyrophosphatase [Parcubacteria group bacterium]
MGKKIIVVGHKNPDTDSIIASIAGADYCRNILKQDAEPVRAGNINKETKFILDKFKVRVPAMFRPVGANAGIVLVDHNEASQLADGLDFSKVERIIDHHKLQIATEKPISCRVETVGSTSTLLVFLYKEAGRKIPAAVAKLLVAGILSDTLNLTSPTTADVDKKAVKELNKTAKLKLVEFAKEMFAAKSDLTGVSISTVVNSDYKLFEMGKNKVGAAVWETADPVSVERHKEKIVKFLKEKKSQERLDYLFFFVVDILKQNSVLYAFSDKEKAVAEKVFRVKAKADEIVLPGIVSRKKQIIPPLTEELAK